MTYLYMKLFDCNLSHFEICPLLPPLNINKGTFLATKKGQQIIRGLKHRRLRRQREHHLKM